MSEQPIDPIAHPYPPGTRTVVRDVVGCARCGKSHTIEFRPLSGEIGAYRWWAMCPETGEPILMAPAEANGRCETCRWWDRLKHLGAPVDEGRCTQMPTAPSSSDLPAGLRGKPVLRTTSDFGCIRWEVGVQNVSTPQSQPQPRHK